MMHIDDLLPEELQKVLSYLTLKEKFRCERVCRRWQKHVYASVNALAFKDSFAVGDIFLSHHEHVIKREDWLPWTLNEDENIMECILSKCGRSLRSFEGCVRPATMKTIVKYCKRLLCIKMVLCDLESLKLLSDTFGNQLKCAAVSDNMKHGIPSFLDACPYLTSFALINTDRRVANLQCSDCTSCNSGNLFHIYSECFEPPKHLLALRNLVIEDMDHVTEGTLKTLMLLENLKMVSIYLSHRLNKSPLWKLVLSSWSGLRSLSLHVNHDFCMHLDPLPQNLEYLSLVCFNSNNDNPQCRPVKLLSCLQNLVTLKIYICKLTLEQLRLIMISISSFCPALKDFAFVYDNGFNGDSDEQLAPLLSLTSLKHLALGQEFEISDNFATKVLTTLHHLRLFGDYRYDVGSTAYDYLLPGGPQFWKSLIDKATSYSADHFKLIGVPQGTIYLSDPFPSNISLCPMYTAKLQLSNGFASSKRWSELISEWNHLYDVTLKLKGNNFQNIVLPKRVGTVIIHIMNDTKQENNEALTFRESLPNLKHLTIFQEVMSNQQLQTTLACIAELCFNIHTLDLDRGSEVHDRVDECVLCLVNCQSLYAIRFSENFAISDECSIILSSEIPDLCQFGC